MVIKYKNVAIFYMGFSESVQGLLHTISSKVQEAISTLRNKAEDASKGPEQPPAPFQSGGRRKKKQMTKRKKRRQPRSTKKRNFRK
jgi:hypothetical protein